jgi:hypothetical protein
MRVGQEVCARKYSLNPAVSGGGLAVIDGDLSENGICEVWRLFLLQNSFF